MSLVREDARGDLEKLELRDDGVVLYQRGFLPSALADKLVELCLYGTNEDGSRVVPWKQDMITVGDRKVQEARLRVLSQDFSW